MKEARARADSGWRLLLSLISCNLFQSTNFCREVTLNDWRKSLSSAMSMLLQSGFLRVQTKTGTICHYKASKQDVT